MTLISTKATLNVDTGNQSNPTHRYEQTPRPAAEYLHCDDCDEQASVDGMVPVDRFVVTWQDQNIILQLCLGCLADRRGIDGQDVRRV